MRQIDAQVPSASLSAPAPEADGVAPEQTTQPRSDPRGFPGAVCLALTAAGVYRLALLVLRPSAEERLRRAFCWLAGAVAACDLGLVWGAMSGLEVSLSCALATWAIYYLLAEERTSRLRVS